MQAAISPNGGGVKERRTLEDRFGSRVEVNNAFTRKTVSYQGNRHVVRLIEGYFFEMALIISELGRILRPGGTVIMVNDNVQYHRGLALLPQKRVADIAVPVSSWEDGSRKSPITDVQSSRVARLYNAVTSSIIEGTTNWTLENGYRNIIANMSIGLDGTFRNIIGRDAENLMKARITDSTVS